METAAALETVSATVAPAATLSGMSSTVSA